MSSGDPGASPGGDRRAPAERADAGDRPRPASFRSAVVGGLRDPVIVVFLLAGTFDVLAGDHTVDGAILFAVALALGWDAARRPGGRAEAAWSTGEDPAAPPGGEAAAPARSPRRPSGLPRSPLVAIGGLAYAVLVAGFARYSWPATVAVAGPAAAAVAVGWRRPVGDHAGPERLPRSGVVAWSLVFVALALWELTALLLQPSLTTDSWAHPTISVLMDPVLATHLGRLVVLSLWLASGWFLLGL
jgi:hypothetical protein